MGSAPPTTTGKTRAEGGRGPLPSTGRAASTPPEPAKLHPELTRYGNRATLAALRARRAHEGGGSAVVVQAKTAVGDSAAPAEVDADRAASAALAGREANVAAAPAESGAATVDGNFGDRLGPAAPLPRSVRDRLEPGFGPLDHVRVHDTREAASAARTLGARAFAVGPSIGFARGEYAPGTHAGLALLAHEVAHVVQQAGGDEVVRRRLAYAGLDDDPGAALLEVMRAGFRRALTDTPEPQFRDSFFTDLAAFADSWAGGDPERERMRERLNSVLNLTDSDDQMRAYAALGALAALDAQSGVDDLEASGLSVGLETAVEMMAEGAAALLLPIVDPSDANEAQAWGATFALMEAVDSVASATRTPLGRYRLELGATIIALGDARMQLADPNADRAALGERIGRLARRALLLDAAIAGLRAAGDPPSDLAAQTQDAAARLSTIRGQARGEASTLAPDALGRDIERLTVRTMPRGLPMVGSFPELDRAEVNPEEAFPETVDQATVSMIQQTTSTLEGLDRAATTAQHDVIPESPSYTLDEFVQVYHRWFAFFSPEQERRSPGFQLAMFMFDPAIAQEMMGESRADAARQARDLRSVYDLTGIPTGISGVSASFARVIMLDMSASMLEQSLIGASTDFSSEVGAQAGRRTYAVGGSATSPYADLRAGFTLGADPDRLASPEDVTRAYVDWTTQTYAGAATSPPSPTDQHPNEELLRRLLGPQRAARAASDRDAPIVGLSPNPETGWQYLVDVFEPTDPDAGTVEREVRTMPPEVARYLLAREQQRVAAHDAFIPRTAAGEPVGDVVTRTRGLEEADALNAARMRGEISPAPTRELLALRAALTRARRSAPDAPEGVAGGVVRELEAYLDAYFQNRTDTVYRFAAVLSIAIQEHGVAADIRETFSIEHLAHVILVTTAVSVGTAILNALGPAGQAIATGINAYMTAQGGAPMQSLTGLLFYLRRVSQVSNLQSARAWAYLTRPVIGDLRALIDLAISHAVTGVVGEVMERVMNRPPGTPAELARSARELIAREPAAREPMLEAIREQMAHTDLNSPEHRALEAMQNEITGMPAVDPAVQAARDEALPGQQADSPDLRALEFARPRSEADRAAIEATVPADLRNRVVVIHDPLLSGSTIHVVGTPSRVEVHVGREVDPSNPIHAASLQAHMETARDLSRFTGTMGRVRDLLGRIGLAEQRVRTRGQEAQREVDKLDRMITELRERQAALEAREHDLEEHGGTYSAEERVALQNEIDSLERQLVLHAEELGSVDNPRGFIAAVDSRATLRDALIRAGRTRVEANDFVRAAERDGHLDAMAQLVSSDAFARLVAAGLTPERIRTELAQPDGYRRLEAAVRRPNGREARDLGIAGALADQRLASARAEIARTTTDRVADEWGIDSSGAFDATLLPGGWTVDAIERVARRSTPPDATMPRIVYRRWRYRQHVGSSARSFETWAESGYRANVNRDVSSPFEAAAILARGGTPNNDPAAASGQETHDYDEWVDEHGRFVPPGANPNRKPRGAADWNETTTRPDGIRRHTTPTDFDVIEHKHMLGETTVLDDSIQLRAQREMATLHNGVHEVVLSSDRELTTTPAYSMRGSITEPVPPVRPSTPLGSASVVYYFDAGANRITHHWTAGHWERFEP